MTQKMEMRSDRLWYELQLVTAQRDEFARHLNYWLDSQEPLTGQNDRPSLAHREMWQAARALLTRIESEKLP